MSGTTSGNGGTLASLARIAALIRKESYQVLRDPSSIIVGIVMPMVLLILFGYGLSFDVKRVPLAVVMEESSDEARELAAGFSLSEYFSTIDVRTMVDAERLLKTAKIDGIARIPADFARDLALGKAEVQVVVNGTDANTARIVLSYAQGAVGSWAARHQADGRLAVGVPQVVVESRLWFNAANNSQHFLVPGLIVLVMTLIGALLTSLVVAREWERGTFEALFVTPVRPVEILLGKTVPYFVLGMLGLGLSIAGSQVLFDVPMRGSLPLLIFVSSLYLMVALGMGLVISSVTRNQFVSSQITLIVSFLPALILSGFIFDIRSMPDAVRLISYIFPARYFVSVLQTLFLAGNVWSVVLPNAAVLAGMALALMTIAVRSTQKSLR